MRLREIRRARDVTQDELCAASGVSRTTISYLENYGDSYCATTKTLNKLAAALGCEVSDILAPSSKEIASEEHPVNKQEEPPDSAGHTETRLTVEVDEDEMQLLFHYRASKLNELGRERLLGYMEGLQAAGMRSAPTVLQHREGR